MPSVKTNGSEPWFQTSLLDIQQLAFAFMLPADELLVKLRNQGITAALHDRFPFRLVADALVREGWEQQRLELFR